MRLILWAVMLCLSLSAGAADRSQLDRMLDDQVGSIRAGLLRDAGPYLRSTAVDEIVEAMSLADVDVLVSSRPFPGGALYFPNMIILGANMLELPRAELAFVIAHEYGHHVHQHWKSTLTRGVVLALAAGVTPRSVDELVPYVEAGVTSDVRYRDEYEADAVAARLLSAAGLFNAQAIERLLLRIGASPAPSHPAGADRYAKLLSQLK